MKISVNLSEAATDTVRDLAAQRGGTVPDVIREALAAYKWINDQLDSGYEFQLQRDGRRESVVWVFR